MWEFTAFNIETWAEPAGYSQAHGNVCVHLAFIASAFRRFQHSLTERRHKEEM